MNELDFFIKTIIPIFSGFGIISFIWNVYNFYQTQKGFMSIKLECDSKYNGKNKYVISKTAIENTGRFHIKIEYAYLLIFKKTFSYHEMTGYYIPEDFRKKYKKKKISIGILKFLKNGKTM